MIENNGVGIDNYSLAFKPKLKDKKSGLIIDKAHNEYLQKILCEGIISGILYTVFMFYIFLDKSNYNSSSLYFGLFLAFTAYCVQAFFNISVTRVAPFFYIILGLLLHNKIENKEKKIKIKKYKECKIKNNKIKKLYNYIFFH